MQPRAVEHLVRGEIASVKVRGIVDLLDSESGLFDFNTSSRRPNAVAPKHRLQLRTHEMITSGASCGAVRAPLPC